MANGRDINEQLADISRQQWETYQNIGIPLAEGLFNEAQRGYSTQLPTFGDLPQISDPGAPIDPGAAIDPGAPVDPGQVYIPDLLEPELARLTPTRADYNRAATEAGGTVGARYGQAREGYRRQLGRYGINPASGRYSSGLRRIAMDEAAARAGAMTASGSDIENRILQRGVAENQGILGRASLINQGRLGSAGLRSSHALGRSNILNQANLGRASLLNQTNLGRANLLTQGNLGRSSLLNQGNLARAGLDMQRGFGSYDRAIQREDAPFQRGLNLFNSLSPLAGGSQRGLSDIAGRQDAADARSDANRNQFWQGAGQLAGTAITAYALSDDTMKSIEEKVGETGDGLGVYRFRYLGEPGEHVGVMASEVEQVKPEAIMRRGGLRSVDYAQV